MVADYEGRGKRMRLIERLKNRYRDMKTEFIEDFKRGYSGGREKGYSRKFR